MDKESKEAKENIVEVEIDTQLSILATILAKISIVAFIFCTALLIHFLDQPSSELSAKAWRNFGISLSCTLLFVTLSFAKYSYRFNEDSQTLEYVRQFFSWDFCTKVAEFKDVVALTAGGEQVKPKHGMPYWRYSVYLLLSTGKLIKVSKPIDHSTMSANGQARHLAGIVGAQYVEAPSESYVAVQYDENGPQVTHNPYQRPDLLWLVILVPIIGLVFYCAAQ